jgi:hypothetical protein
MISYYGEHYVDDNNYRQETVSRELQHLQVSYSEPYRHHKMRDEEGGISFFLLYGVWRGLACFLTTLRLDHVHLTDDGYKAMAAGLLKEATSLRVPREKGPNKGLIRQPTVTWNGFSSHSGIGKTSLKPICSYQPMYLRCCICTSSTIT